MLDDFRVGMGTKDYWMTKRGRTVSVWGPCTSTKAWTKNMDEIMVQVSELTINQPESAVSRPMESFHAAGADL